MSIAKKLDDPDCYKVGELIEALQEYPPDSPVVFVCDYADYNRTQQVLQIRTVFGFARNTIRKTSYRHSGMKFVKSENDPGCDDEVVVLGM